MQELVVSIEHPVATITINRPEQRNAINHAMWQAIPELCARLDADPAVRVVVWRGAGEEAFSAGGDIAEFAEVRSSSTQARHYNDQVQRALESVLGMGKPTLAVIKGYCVAGGLMLAAYCDLRVAAANARFSIPVARLGAVLPYAQVQRCLQLMGAAATLELLLTARSLDAAEACVRGLCNQVFPLDQIDDAVAGLAARIGDLSPLSQRVHKRMVEIVFAKPQLATLGEEEIGLVDACFDSADYAEGTAAFMEKRPPQFTGQ